MFNKIIGSSIVLEHLTKIFDNRVIAVNDVSLEIKKGEFITLLGPSGSGKTTILMMIAGFQTPTSGNIYIDEVPITNVPPFRRNIGLVFQHYALFPHMNVFDNVAFSLKMRKMSKEEIFRRVNPILELVELPGLGERFPKQLSGGQQQRVALARALVFNPKVLLMDEPLGALDKKLREQMQLEIKRMQEKLKITVVYVTHDQSEALTMSDRIAILNHGTIEQVDHPGAIYRNPNNQFVADFIGESNLLAGEIQSIDKDIVTMKTTENLEVKIACSDVGLLEKQLNLVIRPEKISIFESGLDYSNLYANIYEGIVEEVIYLGESTKYRVKTNPGKTLIVKQQNISEEEIFARGSQVKIGWGIREGVLV